MANKILVIILCLILIFTIGGVSAATADDSLEITDESASDNPISINQKDVISISNESEVLSDGDTGTFTELNTKISNSNNGDTIELDKNYTYDSDMGISGIEITKSITIDGHNYTIDALNTSRIFNIESANVILKNINFINAAYSGENGGGIYSSAGYLTIINCTFTNCSASNGSAVYIDGGNNLIKDSTFTNRDMNNVNWTYFNEHSPEYGGAIYISQGNNIIENSTFLHNYATVNGGAVYINGDKNTVRKSKFIENYALYGGAVHLDGNNNLIETSEFINNGEITLKTQTDNPPIIIVGPDYPPIIGPVIDNPGNLIISPNDPSNGGDILIPVDPNDGKRGGDTIGIGSMVYRSEFGGAVYLNGTESQIIDSNFSQNHAEFGGAVYINSTDSIVDNSNFTFNNAGSGGAILSVSNNLTINNSFFASNEAGNGYVYNEDSELSDSLHLSLDFTDKILFGGGSLNIAGDNTKILNSEFYTSYSNSIGGAIYLTGSNANLDSLKFAYNYANDFGGAVFVDYESENSKINNCNFTTLTSIDNIKKFLLPESDEFDEEEIIEMISSESNAVGTSGGAVFWDGFNGTVSNSIFTKNNATYGGAVSWFGDNGTINNTKFDNNSISTEYNFELGMMQGGSSVFWIGNYGKILNSNFTNDNSFYGSVLWYDDIEKRYDNTTWEYIENGDYKISVNGLIENCNFINNSAIFGAAIVWLGFNGTVKDSYFTNNSAQMGGAVMWVGMDGTIISSNFTSNNASNEGGAVINKAIHLSVIDSRFIKNIAQTGGAFANYGVELDNLGLESTNMTLGSRLFMDNSIFIENYALMGGGILMDSYSAVINNSKFYNNSALEAGAVYMLGNHVIVDNSIFMNNTAYIGGVAILGIYDEYSESMFYNSTIKNSFFANNSAEYAGTILVNDYGTKIDNVTFMDNKMNYYDLDKLNKTINSYYFDLMFEGASNQFNDQSYLYLRSSGTALYWIGDNGFLNNSTFINNNASGLNYNAHTTTYEIIEYDISIDEYSYYVDNKEDLIEKYAVELNDNYDFDDYDYLAIQFYPNEELYKIEFVIYHYNYFNRHEPSKGGAIYWIGSNGLINDSDFIKNTADYGGAIMIDGGALLDSSNVTINASNFYDNLATFSAGAILVAFDDVTVNNTLFKNNNAIYDSERWDSEYYGYSLTDYISSSGGGAVFWIGLNGVIDNGTFINNYAEFGGAVMWYEVIFDGVRFGVSNNGTIINSKFENNTANYAGALYLFSNNHTVYNTEFNNNTAVENGGAIYIEANNITINKSNFTNNTAVNGGAITVDGNSTLINNSYFKGNDALEYGGAIYWLCDDGLIDSTVFENNTAVNGGAIYWIGEKGNIINSYFQYNKAKQGSAMYVIPEITIKSTVFSQNQAETEELISSIEVNDNTVTLTAIFSGYDNLINALFVENTYNLNNVTYWSTERFVNSDDGVVKSQLESGQNITLDLYDSKLKLIYSITNVTNTNGQAIITVPNVKGGRYSAISRLKEDSYYTLVENFEIIKVGLSDAHMDLTVDDISYTENATVNIKLDDDVTGNVTFNIDGKNYTNKTLNNGFATIEVPGLTGGLHNVTVYYEGDENYTRNQTTQTFYVKPINSTITISPATGEYSKDTDVKVTVNPGEVTGKIIVTIADEYGKILTITDSTEFTLTINNLDAGTYTINAFYTGDNNYLSAYNESVLTVKPTDLNADASAKDTLQVNNVTFTINVPADFNGKANITVDDVTRIYDIAGSTQVTFDKVDLGNKKANITFYGDTNYKNESITVEFNVIAMEINATIKDVTYPDNAIAVINISCKANGTVEITVDNKTFTGTVNNGSAIINLTGLSAGEKHAQIKFINNNEEFSNQTTVTFNIIKRNSTLIITQEENNVKITVTENATGNMTVYINGVEKQVKIENTPVILENVLEIGNNTVIAIYAGDKNFTGSNNISTIEIPKINPTIKANATVNKTNATLTVNINDDATGLILISINGTNYYANITKGNATLNITDLNPGNYTVKITYIGDEKYTSSNTTLKITVNEKPEPVNPNMNVTLQDNVLIGDNPELEIQLPGDASGNVTVFVDGNKVKSFAAGSDELKLSLENLTVGNHTVSIIYSGDNNYTSSENITNIIVSKLPVTVNASGVEVTIGEPVVISVNVTRGATGIVLVDIDGNKYYGEINNGNTEVIVVGLTVGNYTAVVTYLGDDKYFNNTVSVSVKVNPVPELIDPVMNVLVDKEIKIGENPELEIELPGDATGNVTVFVDGVKIDVIPAQKDIKLTLVNLTVGNHTVTVQYSGDDNYTVSENITNIIVSKLPVTVNASGVEVTIGEPVVISVNVTNGATGIVLVDIEGNRYYGEISDGKTEINIVGLTVGNYTAVVTYLGDDKYFNNTTSVSVKINPVPELIDPVMNVSVDNEIKIGENPELEIELPGDATGNVTVFVDGNKVKSFAAGSDELKLILENLTVGNHTVTVQYSGDDNYTVSENITNIVVSKLPVTVNASGVEVTIGEPVVISVNVTRGAAGIVLVDIEGNRYYGEINNGNAEVIVVGLTVGNYTAVVTYLGDDKYFNNTTSVSVKVNQVPELLNTNMNVTLPDNALIGDNPELEIELPGDATGNVTVFVDGVKIDVIPAQKDIKLALENLTVGNHTVTVQYSGDENYTSSENITNIIVSKLPVTVNATSDGITEGETVVIGVNVTRGATGIVLVDIDGNKYYGELNGSQVIINASGVKAGEYNAVVTYLGDDKYFNNTVSVSVKVNPVPELIDPNMNVSLANEIKIGENPELEIELPGDATGNVTVFVDGNKVKSFAVGSDELKLVLENLTVGNHTVTVQYSGYDNYTSSENTTLITVSKLSAIVNTTSDEITEGETVVINVNVTSGATGIVLVDINGNKYYGEITNGQAIINASGVKAGEYNAIVTYLGDDKYFNNTASVNVKVNQVPELLNPDMNVSLANEIKIGENPELEITLSENATGNVTVFVDGNKVKSFAVGSDELKLVLENLTVGNHTVTVQYSGDENYTSSENTTLITVSKLPAIVNAISFDITEGETLTVNVTVSSDATGIILVDIDGNKYYGEINNGKTIISVNGLTEGNYTAVVTYIGDDKYFNNTTNVAVEVNPGPELLNPDMNVSLANEIKIGENPELEITLPENATGNVTVLVDGAEITTVPAEKDIKLTLNNLTAGTHTVTVQYSGDDNYTSSNNIATLTVSKLPVNINATSDEITEGESLTVNVSVPSDATGIILVDIDGNKYYGEISNGQAIINASGLKSGEYNAVVTYLGDANYINNTTNVNVKVNSVPKAPELADPNMNVSADDINVGEVSNITVELPENATGNITVIVDGNELKTLPVENGKLTIPLENLKAGNHTIITKYSGDDNYSDSENITVLTVSKLPAPISAESNECETPSINVTVPSDATGIVLVEIDGNKYYGEISNGKAIINAIGLTGGNYTANITYLGDDKYYSNTTSIDVKVKPENKPADANMNVTLPNNTTIGNVPELEISLPQDATGNATVLVDGVEIAVVPVENGNLTVPLENLTLGNHIVEVKYSGDDKYLHDESVKIITVNDIVKPRIDTILIANQTLTRQSNDYYKAGEEGDWYYVTLMDTNGNLLANKTIQVAINGAHYNLTTDVNGRAYQKVNMESANVYTYAFFFQGDDDYNASNLTSTRLTVTKKPTSIVAKSKSFKASAKSKKITVTFKTVANPYDGKIYLSSGKVIKLTINGKTYTGKTNSKNQVTFNIKLTKKGTYTGKIKFGGTKIYKASSKKIKVKIQ